MKLTYLVARYVLVALWQLANAIYTLIQRYIVWTLLTSTGRQLKLVDSRATSGLAPTSGAVQRLLVMGRFKLDAYLTGAHPYDFLVTHDRFVDVDYLLKPNVTLYCVSPSQATFVETSENIEVWKASCSPFIMPAQFQHAHAVLRVPLGVFHQLADRLGDPRQQVIFLTNTARCGSTLLTQMFESTRRITSISEPSSLNILSLAVQHRQDSATDRLIVSTVRVLCKPTGHDELAFALKLTAPSMRGLPVVLKLFPTARGLFMYRNSLKMAQSLYRLSEELPALKTLFVVGKGSGWRLGKCVEAMSMPGKDYEFAISQSLSLGALLWAATLKNYIQFLQDRVDVVGVRYEDIVDDPESAMRQILAHCRLPADLASSAGHALTLDSQRNTPLANHVLRRHRTLEYQGQTKVECDWIMDKLGAPRLGVDYVAPATITAQST